MELKFHFVKAFPADEIMWACVQEGVHVQQESHEMYLDILTVVS